MCSISFTSWWQWKPVKIVTVIKGTSGTGKKKKNSSAVGESGSAAHVCLSKSKVETAEPLLTHLLWEPGAQNHLRSPTVLPRGNLCPLQALSMFKSFISVERLRCREGGCHIKLKAREKYHYCEDQGEKKIACREKKLDWEKVVIFVQFPTTFSKTSYFKDPKWEIQFGQFVTQKKS